MRDAVKALSTEGLAGLDGKTRVSINARFVFLRAFPGVL